MPFETIPGTNDQYALLSFDLEGRERTDDPQGVGGLLSKEILKRVTAEQPSHVLFFCHGWKGDVDPDAIVQPLDRGDAPSRRRPPGREGNVQADLDRSPLAEPAIRR